jgi:hypothetical protein
LSRLRNILLKVKEGAGLPHRCSLRGDRWLKCQPKVEGLSDDIPVLPDTCEKLVCPRWMTGRGNHERPAISPAPSLYQPLRVEQMDRALNGSPTYTECLSEFSFTREAITWQDQLERDRSTKLLCDVLMRSVTISPLECY